MIGKGLSGSKDIQLLKEKIRQSDSIAISGHISPDGDCVGSCLGLCTYIKEQYPEKTVDVILEAINPRFTFLAHADQILHQDTLESIESSIPDGISYDLYFSLDCSDPERLGFAREYFEKAPFKVCIDHHITNQGFGDLRFIKPDASSTCEVLYTIMDEKKISLSCAQALYMGIVHDTGVFKHNNTTRKTMEIAGALIEKGVETEVIIDDTFYKKTYVQNQILGRALMESILLMDGKVIFSVISLKDMTFYGIDGSDLDGIIDQLRVTAGVEAALLLREKEERVYKVSMRSNGLIDVSQIALSFGGGGHVRAAGCTMHGDFRDVINSITAQIEDQMENIKLSASSNLP